MKKIFMLVMLMVSSMFAVYKDALIKEVDLENSLITLELKDNSIKTYYVTENTEIDVIVSEESFNYRLRFLKPGMSIEFKEGSFIDGYDTVSRILYHKKQY